MSVRRQAAEEISDEFISVVVARAVANERVRRSLPGGGRIHLDRRLPFLCVYRKPAGREDAGTDKLITTEAASLLASGDTRSTKQLPVLVHRLTEALAAHFGGFLIVELWSGSDDQVAESVHPESGEPIPPAPAFRIGVPKQRVPQRTIETLAKSLRRIKALKRPAEVEVDPRLGVCAPGRRPLVTPAEAKRLGCYELGLEVRPIYRNAATGQAYPTVLRRIRRGLGRALKQAFFTFAYFTLTEDA